MIRATLRPLAGSALAAVLALAALASSAPADTYPPGPDGCCPDTLTIINLRNPAAVPHPGNGDVVLGVGGIITGFTNQVGTYGFYMQMSNGLPYSGVAVFTGNVDAGPGSAQNLQVGDSVVVYAKVAHFSDTDGMVIGSASASVLDNPNDIFVRLVSSGNPEPPTHVGTLAELREPQATPAGDPWLNMLVRLPGPLVTTADGPNTFFVRDPSCEGAECDSAFVDGDFLVTVPAPPPGTTLTFVRGIFDNRQGQHQILLRNAGDFTAGSPPLAIDAYPLFDNDQPGADRVDSVLVVFDRAVERTSAENVENYSLASLGTVDGARRLDEPEDDRVVLHIRNAGPDGANEAITVSGVRSLADDTAMLEPQTLEYLNGVLELDEIGAPDPDGLAVEGGGCTDRSRFSTGQRASFTGTVTGAFGEYYTLQAHPSLRAGLWVHLPDVALVPGNQILVAGALQEIGGETQGVNAVYVRDLGPGPSFVPAIQSIRILTDDTCDEGQRFLTGDDYEGMLVTVDRVEVVGSAPPGGSFSVRIPGTGGGFAAPQRIASGPQNEILIANPAGNFTFAATGGEIVTVTGVLGRVDGAFAIFPRGDGDIFDFGPVPTFSLPLDVSKSATQSRDPDIVLGLNGELFMTWWRVHEEAVHSLSLDNTQNWSTGVPMPHQGAQPGLAVTPSNKIGVISSGVDALFFKQSTDGGFQMDPLVTTVDGFPTRYPALTVGNGEHFHAAWERTGAGVFYARSLTGGEDFSPPFAIATNGSGNQNSMARICASSADHVLVFWQYDEPGEPGVHRVLYRRSIDGGTTFGAARRVRDEANPLTSTVKLAFLGDARIGPDGTFYVMGLDETGAVVFLQSTNDGLTFKLAGLLPEPAPRGSLCPKSFAVGPGGEIHALVGVCGTALFYTRSGDGGATWGPAVNVSSASSPNVGEPRGAKIILDGTGTPVIVWFSSVGGSTEIYSSRLLN